MTKKKILYTVLAIYFLLIFIPVTIYIYSPNLFSFIKNSRGEKKKKNQYLIKISLIKKLLPKNYQYMIPIYLDLSLDILTNV